MLNAADTTNNVNNVCFAAPSVLCDALARRGVSGSCALPKATFRTKHTHTRAHHARDCISRVQHTRTRTQFVFCFRFRFRVRFVRPRQNKVGHGRARRGRGFALCSALAHTQTEQRRRRGATGPRETLRTITWARRKTRPGRRKERLRWWWVTTVSSSSSF